MKTAISLLLTCSALLISCTTVSYQELDGHVPDGYSQIQIDDDHYRITYETYKETTKDLLSGMVTFRAAELTLANEKTHFEILSTDFVEETIRFKIPEQRIAHAYINGEPGPNGASHRIRTDAEYLIPAYFSPHQIMKEQIEIKITDTNENERSVAAQKIINKLDFRK